MSVFPIYQRNIKPVIGESPFETVERLSHVMADAIAEAAPASEGFEHTYGEDTNRSLGQFTKIVSAKKGKHLGLIGQVEYVGQTPQEGIQLSIRGSTSSGELRIIIVGLILTIPIGYLMWPNIAWGLLEGRVEFWGILFATLMMIVIAAWIAASIWGAFATPKSAKKAQRELEIHAANVIAPYFADLEEIER